jgi:DNA-binding GntR family transcriptional regulator
MYDYSNRLGEPLHTRQEMITARLREVILRGYFKPGQKLDQNAIAHQLRVSRSPVREALRTLAAEGLVEIVPNHGAMVTELSIEELEEILFLRSILEGMAARLAVPQLKPTHVTALESILLELELMTDLDRWIELNDRFHQTIYEVAHRPRLLALIVNLRNTVAPYIRQYIATSEHMRDAAASHQEILRACIERNSVLVEQATQEHLAAVRENLLVRAGAPMAIPVRGAVQIARP